MKSFLQEVSEHILAEYQDLRKIEIIVPNRRTGLFIKKHISELTQKTIWLPKITPIQDFFYKNSDLQIAEDIILIHRLYKVFISNTGSKESFDDFYYWGEIILSDFDDIDKYLVDADKLFTTIADIKEIDTKFDGYEEEAIEIIKKFWFNVNQAQISTHKQSFLDLWQAMFKIYRDFKLGLYKENIAYQGMIYKDVIENLSECNFDSEDYVVVGFNALNKCEKKFLNVLKSHAQVNFFWDADKYYINDPHQEAGRFIRENIKYYKPFNEIGIVDNINHLKKNIEVIMAPSPVSQTKLIPEILNKWIKELDYNPEKTAIVLGDEHLLIPLMYSIPENIKNYNVSMGFPVRNSMSAAFIQHILVLQQSYKDFNGEIKFYFKSVLSILNHSFFKVCEPIFTEELRSQILSGKLIYVSENDLRKSDLFNMIFSFRNSTTSDISSYLSEVLQSILTNISSIDEFVMESEILNKILLRINALKDCITHDNINFETNTIFIRLVSNIIRNLNVAFEGEPLQGLQILGFLETRSLDFDRVIMLSINEGIFPKASVSQSLVPYNLRKFHELPSIEYKDSIFAYYFYRLLQRAKDIKIIYSAQSGDGASEASRFISQIKYELNQPIKFTSKAYKIEIDSGKINSGQKNDKTISLVKNHLNRGISPKAINEYLNCKFRYYLNYIEKIREPEKVEEEEDAAFFGRLFHGLMQKLYEPFINKVLTENDLEIFTDKYINEKMLEVIKELTNAKSKHEIIKIDDKIIVDIVKKYVKQLIKYDRSNLPLTLTGLEIRKEVIVHQESNDNKWKIAGTIDRTDILQGLIRVLDYKTGSTKLNFNSISDLFDSERGSELNTATQILLYSMMIKSEANSEICPGIININALGDDFDMRLTVNRKKLDILSDEMTDDIMINLKSMFEEMLDENIKFDQTTNLKNCTYCLYKNICEK
jgi:CRISPR/Cas system-associated exonuclease Cas4 (RecB family)